MYDRFDMGFSDLIKWKTRLYGYTTYERTEVEWENTLHSSLINISRQISSYIRDLTTGRQCAMMTMDIGSLKNMPQ